MDAADEEGQRVAVVGGGAGGLGAGVSAGLAAAGFHVVVVDRDAERAAAVAEGLVRDGHAATAAGFDIGQGDQVRELKETVLSSLGRVDALVNLAGAVRNAVLGKVTEADFHLTYQTHVVTTLLMMREFGVEMKRRGYGRIVNASSVASRGTFAGTSYSAAKGAIEAMTRTAAIELAPFGVTVNCLAPGVVDAGMFQETPEQFRQQALARTPMRRAGRVDEIAACVNFLVSDGSGFVTGQTLFACGGASIGGI